MAAVSEESQATITTNTLDGIDYQKLSRSQRKDSHKGDFGHVAVVGGNIGMHGSIYLAARAAMLLGSGKVTMVSLDTSFSSDSYLSNMPELMFSSTEQFLENAASYTVVVVGPGFGGRSHNHEQNNRAYTCLQQILIFAKDAHNQQHWLFDADALNLLAQYPELCTKFCEIKTKIITPHPAEAARLLNISTNAVQNNRCAAITKLTQSLKTTTLLKGAGSLIQDTNLHIYLSENSNPTLANAGQGDTLCGIIAALLAQGLNTIEGLRLAVYLQYLAADELAHCIGYAGVLASEVANTCRSKLNQLLCSM